MFGGMQLLFGSVRWDGSSRLTYVARDGYTIINDVTARERQRDHKQFYIGKSPDTFCPMVSTYPCYPSEPKL